MCGCYQQNFDFGLFFVVVVVSIEHQFNFHLKFQFEIHWGHWNYNYGSIVHREIGYDPLNRFLLFDILSTICKWFFRIICSIAYCSIDLIDNNALKWTIAIIYSKFYQPKSWHAWCIIHFAKLIERNILCEMKIYC